MKPVYRLWVCFLLLGSGWPAAAVYSMAQEHGAITGVVVEAGTDEGLGGVNVYIKGTVIGVISAFDGHFRLEDLHPGTYTVVASLIGFGYEEQEVVLETGEERTLRFAMTERPVSLEEVIALADRSYSAASSMAVRGFDLRTRPTRSAQDLLRLAPGVFIAQHAGGGKAEQIFLRGFDADHGTDVALSVDGLPVNMVSHGHGQGYADLHFVIPETIEEMQVQKGPYFAERGNLATAGAITFRTREHFESNLIRLEGGQFDTRQITTLYQIPLPGEHQGAYLAGQFYNTDGAVESPQAFRRANMFGKFHTHLSETAKLSFSVSGFSSAWDASGQVPQRAVQQGLITRFGAIDDREGGTTGRQDLNLIYEVYSGDNRNLTLQAFVSRYDFKLFSNFTFFLENPDEGDMIEQTDARIVRGLNSQYQFSRRIGTGLAVTTLGGGFRSDDIDVSLWQSPNRQRMTSLVDAMINERNLYLWLQEELVFNPRIRLQLGLRGDYFTYNVEDRLEGVEDAPLPHASGYAQQTILSPKVNLVVTPHRAIDLFANFGMGFHSNDARNIILGQRVRDLTRAWQSEGQDAVAIRTGLAARHFDPDHRVEETLPRATGAEVGTRVRAGHRLVVSGAAWWMHLDREYVYVGDGGFTELSGATRRLGVDLEARYQFNRWLWADGDITLSRGIFIDEPEDRNAIALAPRLTLVSGLTARHPSGWDASLRVRHIGDRPANEKESVTAEGYTVFDLMVSYPVRSFRLQAAIENLLNVAWNEAQFDTESRLRTETTSLSELHFTPGNPFNLRVGISYLF